MMPGMTTVLAAPTAIAPTAIPMTTVAAPQMASYVAPPTTLQPTVQSLSYVAPPAPMYAAPAQSLSYVAPPAPMYAAPPAVIAAPAPAMVAVPQGQQIPDPDTVGKQKAAYEEALKKQFQDGAAQISQESKIRKDQLMAAANQQKAQFRIQKEAELQAQNLLLDQQMNSQMMMLQEATMTQRTALEQQAAALVLEYQQKKAQEEMMFKQYQIQQQFYEAEVNLAKRYDAVTHMRPVPPPQAPPGPHPNAPAHHPSRPV